MPGSSLWLLPPASHPLNDTLSILIRQTSSRFDSPHLFIPHITLTSEIDASTYSQDPQAWLDSIPFPSGSSVKIQFANLQSEDVFVRKLYVRIEKPSLEQIGKVSRQRVLGFETETVAREWVARKYAPHLSLLYHDCPQVSEQNIQEIERLVEDIGVSLKGEGELKGWTGGRVVLVPTDRPITEWKPIAERHL